MMKKFRSIKFALLVCLLLATSIVNAQSKANYDESKIPEYVLPDLLELLNGEKVKDAITWTEQRRPEILHLFEEEVYGRIPGEINITSAEVLEENNNALNNQAIRKQVVLKFKKDEHELEANLLIYLPKNVENAPLFIGYNFNGNHTIVDEKEVVITKAWVRNNDKLGINENRSSEQSRGTASKRWAVEKIIEAGYGLATIYYGEIDPDNNDFSDGIHPFFYTQNQSKPAANEWGSISAWSWGLSKAMDYFETDENIDQSKVIVMGHSRLGKTSLWAGAMDERFAIVISNNSGCGGAALSRRKIGETVERMNTKFPHWCCSNYDAYNNKVNELPVDQHMLIALIAPRPVYIASAELDKWADPKGEFLSGLYATPVYNLFDKKGITNPTMPEVNQAIQNTIAYHIRTGKHNVTDYDWEQYIKFANKNLK
jgi:hypothetical protein